MKIIDGFEEIEILRWHECEDCTAHLQFSSRLSALFFLRHFKADFMAMTSLRRLAWEREYFRGCSISNDDEILEFVANKLATGELHATRKQRVFAAGGSQAAMQETQPEIEPESAPRIRREVPPAQPQDDSTFPSDVDLAAMAQVHQDAASQGAPFCEL